MPKLNANHRGKWPSTPSLSHMSPGDAFREYRPSIFLAHGRPKKIKQSQQRSSQSLSCFCHCSVQPLHKGHLMPFPPLETPQQYLLLYFSLIFHFSLISHFSLMIPASILHILIKIHLINFLCHETRKPQLLFQVTPWLP